MSVYMVVANNIHTGSYELPSTLWIVLPYKLWTSNSIQGILKFFIYEKRDMRLRRPVMTKLPRDEQGLETKPGSSPKAKRTKQSPKANLKEGVERIFRKK